MLEVLLVITAVVLGVGCYFFTYVLGGARAGLRALVYIGIFNVSHGGFIPNLDQDARVTALGSYLLDVVYKLDPGYVHRLVEEAQRCHHRCDEDLD
jgi:hypothetical protein